MKCLALALVVSVVHGSKTKHDPLVLESADLLVGNFIEESPKANEVAAAAEEVKSLKSQVAQTKQVSKAKMFCLSPRDADDAYMKVKEQRLSVADFDVKAECRYGGSAKVSACSAHGGNYMLSGCRSKAMSFCFAPTRDADAGDAYMKVKEQRLSVADFDVKAECRYGGSAKVSACSVHGGTYVLSGCKSKAMQMTAEEKLDEAKKIVEGVEKERASDAAAEAKEIEEMKKANAKAKQAAETVKEADKHEEVAAMAAEGTEQVKVTNVAVTAVEDAKAARRARLDEAVRVEGKKKMTAPVVPRGELKHYSNPDFGNQDCPCIGFDNVQGETLIFMEGKFVNYPGDLGSRCEAWDDGWHPNSCQEGQMPGKGNNWCAEKWCYVDPRKCKLDSLPQMSHYVPTARYQNMPLFWSYATCGSKLMADPQVETLGNTGCRCTGFDNLPGTMDFKIGVKKVAYPAETGGTCGAWDMEHHPECAVKGEKPAWCSKKWCFVDPCSCSLQHPPKMSGYLADSDTNKRSIFFSYETCGEDVSTAEWNVDLCSIEKTASDCAKKATCAWSGAACLGQELVEKELCKASAVKSSKGTDGWGEKSSAQRMGGAAIALAVLAFLF